LKLSRFVITFQAMSQPYQSIHRHVSTVGWKGKDSKSHWVKKQIDSFCIHPSICVTEWGAEILSDDFMML